MAVAGAAIVYWLSKDGEKKKPKKEDDEPEEPYVKVAEQEAGPNEKRRQRKAKAAAAKQAAAEELARNNAATNEAAAIDLRRRDAKARKEADAVDAAFKADAAAAKSARQAEAKAQQAARGAAKAASKKEADAAIKVLADKKAAKAKAAAGLAKQEGEFKKKREEKKKKLAEAAAQRKKEREAKEAAIKQAAERAKDAAAAEEAAAKANAAAIRKADALKMAAGANWEKMTDDTVAKNEERKQKHMARTAVKVEKNRAKAATLKALAAELVVPPTAAEIAATTSSAERSFTVERMVDDDEEEEEVKEVSFPPPTSGGGEEEEEEEASAAEASAAAADEESAEDNARLDAVEDGVNAVAVDTDAIASKLADIKSRADKAEIKAKQAGKGNGHALAAFLRDGGAPAKKEAKKEVPIAWGTPPAAYMTYEDDKALGQAAPPIDSLEYVQGEPVKLGGGKITVVTIFAKFAKGDYTTINDLKPLVDRFPQVQLVGLSIDPEKSDAEGFVKKIGTSMPEIYIDNLDVPFPLGWDNGKVVKEAFRNLSGLMSLGASACFVVDGGGTIVWREQFGQGHAPHQGQLGKQLELTVAGKALLKNGPNPVQPEAEDAEEEEMDMGDYDSDLGF